MKYYETNYFQNITKLWSIYYVIIQYTVIREWEQNFHIYIRIIVLTAGDTVQYEINIRLH